jgi:PKD repeat protein
MKPAQIIIYILLLHVLPSFGQTNAFTIKINNPEPIQYCKDTVFIANKLTIEGSPNINSIKISITKGYVWMMDELIYQSPDQKITGTWFPLQGYLILSGSSDYKEYEAALRNVKYYKHFNSGTLARGPREITISLGDGDYLPETGHFYRFISHPGINWTVAKKEAEATTYYGMRGYLATITSAVENSFIKTKTKGVGWIGASDDSIPDNWRWVTGPEKDSLFWKGTGAQFKANPKNYGPVNNAYSNWNCNDKYSEPNNSTSNPEKCERYAHITFFTNDPNYSYYWNDLPDQGGKTDYFPAGYLIEFGGMPNDPVLNLSAVVNLEVNSIGFDPVREIAICKGDSVQLNREDLVPSFMWTPSKYLSSATVSNPKTSPENTQRFLVTATNGICKDTASFKVYVNPLPVSLLKPEENICEGTKIVLNPGIHSFYYWNTGSTDSTLEVSTPGIYSVDLKTAPGCKLTSRVKVFLHKYPVINLSALDTLICGSKSITADIASDAENFSLTSPDSHVQTSGLTVQISDFGSYPFIYKAINQYCTRDTTFKIGFHKIPLVSFSIDSTKCYGYNLKASYIGDANIDNSHFTWVFGGDTIADGKGIASNIIPLGVNQNKRDLSIKVADQGCSNSDTIKDIKVIPDLSVQIADSLGCEPFKAEFMAHNSEKVSYEWDYGDGIIEKTDNHPFHTYLTEGFYNLKLKVTTGKGCTNSVAVDSIVHVAPIPTAGFSLDPSQCLEKSNQQIFYTGTGDKKDTYNWDLSAFDVSEIIENPLKTQGPFTFNLGNKPMSSIGLRVVSKYGCTSREARIEVKRKPSFSFNLSANRGCVPLESSFSAITGDAEDRINYTWDFGDGTSGRGSETSHLYTEAGKHYSITLNGLSETTGCFDAIKKDTLVFAYPKPKAEFSLDHSIVYNDKPDVRFENQSQNATGYIWDFGDGGISKEENPIYKVKGHGYRKVLLEAFNDYECSDTISHQVLVALSRIFPPNAFSPNAPQQVNREFKLSQEAIKEEGYHLVIFSRWDDIVFETKNEIKGWDGRMQNGEYAPAGSYVWALDFVDFLGRSHHQTGSVTLLY